MKDHRRVRCGALSLLFFALAVAPAHAQKADNDAGTYVFHYTYEDGLNPTSTAVLAPDLTFSNDNGSDHGSWSTQGANIVIMYFDRQTPAHAVAIVLPSPCSSTCSGSVMEVAPDGGRWLGTISAAHQ